MSSGEDKPEGFKWAVVHDGLSLGMIGSPDGRVFSIQELGADGSRQMWGNAPDNDALCEKIVAALESANTPSSLACSEIVAALRDAVLEEIGSGEEIKNDDGYCMIPLSAALLRKVLEVPARCERCDPAFDCWGTEKPCRKLASAATGTTHVTGLRNDVELGSWNDRNASSAKPINESAPQVPVSHEAGAVTARSPEDRIATSAAAVSPMRERSIDAFITTCAGPAFSREDIREEAKHIVAGTGPFYTRPTSGRFELVPVEPAPTYIPSSGRWQWPLPERARFPGCCTEVVSASREWWEYAPSEAKPHPMAEALQLRDGKWYWSFPSASAKPDSNG